MSENQTDSTFHYTTHNEYKVRSMLEPFVSENSSFCGDSISYLDSQIDSIKFTGRTADGDVDVTDALATNVIDEINKMKLVISSDYAESVSSFIDSAINAAKNKDKIENDERRKLEEEKENVEI